VRRQSFDRIADDVWYAGEAAHETLWGTVGGAWESGERAADAVLRRLGGIKQPAPEESEARPKHKKPAHAERQPRYQAGPQYNYEATPQIMRDQR